MKVYHIPDVLNNPSYSIITCRYQWVEKKQKTKQQQKTGWATNPPCMHHHMQRVPVRGKKQTRPNGSDITSHAGTREQKKQTGSHGTDTSHTKQMICRGLGEMSSLCNITLTCCTKNHKEHKTHAGFRMEQWKDTEHLSSTDLIKWNGVMGCQGHQAVPASHTL